MVGSYTIVPEYIPFKEAQGVMQIMEHQFVKQGDQVFHLLGNKLDTYKYSESGLEFVSSMELENDCEYMSADSSGMLYLSPGIQEVIGVKDGKKALQTTVTGDLNMHPSGEWGISFWVNSDTQKISNQGGNLTAEPWILTGLNNAAEHIGAISTEDIFGVGYPWLEDMQLLDDGSLLILLTQKRNDESANELMFFRLTGF